jgi:hypothetical protein
MHRSSLQLGFPRRTSLYVCLRDSRDNGPYFHPLQISEAFQFLPN